MVSRLTCTEPAFAVRSALTLDTGKPFGARTRQCSPLREAYLPADMR